MPKLSQSDKQLRKGSKPVIHSLNDECGAVSKVGKNPLRIVNNE